MHFFLIDITFILEFPSSSSSEEKERTSLEQHGVFQLFSQRGKKFRLDMESLVPLDEEELFLQEEAEYMKLANSNEELVEYAVQKSSHLDMVVLSSEVNLKLI
jgi:hypothetical protein